MSGLSEPHLVSSTNHLRSQSYRRHNYQSHYRLHQCLRCHRHHHCQCPSTRLDPQGTRLHYRPHHRRLNPLSQKDRLGRHHLHRGPRRYHRPRLGCYPYRQDRYLSTPHGRQGIDQRRRRHRRDRYHDLAHQKCQSFDMPNGCPNHLAVHRSGYYPGNNLRSIVTTKAQCRHPKRDRQHPYNP